MTKTLELLGYAPDERVLIIHADDVAVSHASNVAMRDGLTRGSLTCASAIVAAPWFAETAQMQREDPSLDIGVHLALTADYATYRWRSLSGRMSLHAPDGGGMWRDAADAIAHVTAEDGAAELRAQVEHALAAGIDVTHIDIHTRALLHPKFLPAYVDLAVEFRLPLFFPRLNDRLLAVLGEGAAVALAQEQRLAALGWPLIDNLLTETMVQIEPEDKERRFREMFATLRPGLTHFLCHPAYDGDELRAMTPESWRYRAKEAEIFGAPDMRAYCASLGIRLTGYGAIRDRLRAGL